MWPVLRVIGYPGILRTGDRMSFLGMIGWTLGSDLGSDLAQDGLKRSSNQGQSSPRWPRKVLKPGSPGSILGSPGSILGSPGSILEGPPGSIPGPYSLSLAPLTSKWRIARTPQLLLEPAKVSCETRRILQGLIPFDGKVA